MLVSPALSLSWMDFIAAPWSFISCCRAAIAPSGFFSRIEAQPTATTGISTAAVSIHVRRFISPPVREQRPRGLTVLPLLRDDHLVPDRRHRLQILRDGDAVGLREVLVTGQRAVDGLAHQAAGDVAVGLVAGAEVVRDLLDRPLA